MSDVRVEYFMETENCDLTSGCACQVRFLGQAEGRAEGRIEGRAEGILIVLGSRGIPVPSSVRARIRECTEPARLGLWIQRAVHVDRAEEIFQDWPRRGPEKWANPFQSMDE